MEGENVDQRGSVQKYLGIDDIRAKIIQDFIIKVFGENLSLVEIFKKIEDNSEFVDKEKNYAYFASGSFVTYKSLVQMFNEMASMMKIVNEDSNRPLN